MKRRQNSRGRRAGKEWVKGNRDRVKRIEAEDDSSWDHRGSMRPRAITIDEIGTLDELERGQVTRSVSGQYDVQLDESAEVLACRVKRGASSMNDESTLVAIGDVVRVQPLEDSRGLICHVEERVTHLGRDAAGREGMEHVIAANIDKLYCVVSADKPNFRLTIIDRYVVAALLGGVEPVVVMNKMDTVEGELEEILREEIEIYEHLGYQTFMISAATGEGIEELRENTSGELSVFAGQSGVGKSTITNALLGYEERKTGEVRGKERRGVHTTISSEILSIPDGGRVVDTPGLREFGIWGLKQEELDGYYVEFLDYLQQCKFLPCTHTHEPGCAVIQAVDEGHIDEFRYVSYLAIFESLSVGKKRAR